MILISCTEPCKNNSNIGSLKNSAGNNLNSKNNSNNNNNIDDEEFKIVPPANPQLESWICPENWKKVYHNEIKDKNGNSFFWCEPPLLPRIEFGNYITPINNNNDNNRDICLTEIDGTFPVLGKSECQPLGDDCPLDKWPAIPEEITGNQIYVSSDSNENGTGSKDSPFLNINQQFKQLSQEILLLLEKVIIMNLL